MFLRKASFVLNKTNFSTGDDLTNCKDSTIDKNHDELKANNWTSSPTEVSHFTDSLDRLYQTRACLVLFDTHLHVSNFSSFWIAGGVETELFSLQY